MKPIDILRRMTQPLTDEQVERSLVDQWGSQGRGNASQDMVDSEELARQRRRAEQADREKKSR